MASKIVYVAVAVAIAVIIGVAVAVSSGPSGDPAPPPVPPQSEEFDIIDVGVMLPSTGDLAAHGQDNNIGVQLGLVDFNDYLEEVGASWRMNLVLEDTQSDPIVALEKIQSLNSKGIKFVLGPESSAEVRNIKSYADSNDMVLISPTSTSPSLAIVDNIFRMIPDDTQQGKVLALLFEKEGIKAVVPIYRADVWGDGLYESTRNNFESIGGVMDDGIRYSPEVTVYSTEATLLSSLVDEYINEYSADEVAVLMIGFSETVHLINFAASYDNLETVRWFGSDGSSNDGTLSDDPIASEFTQNTNFVSTQFATSTNEIYQHVNDYFIDFKGSSPNAYAFSSYDSVAVLGKAILETGSTDPLTVRDAIIDVASRHTGAIGTVNLNEAGDLAISDYDLWGIKDGGWYKYGHFYAGDSTFEFESDKMMMDDDEMMDDDKMMMDDDEMMDDDKMDDDKMDDDKMDDDKMDDDKMDDDKMDDDKMDDDKMDDDKMDDDKMDDDKMDDDKMMIESEEP